MVDARGVGVEWAGVGEGADERASEKKEGKRERRALAPVDSDSVEIPIGGPAQAASPAPLEGAHSAYRGGLTATASGTCVDLLLSVSATAEVVRRD